MRTYIIKHRKIDRRKKCICGGKMLMIKGLFICKKELEYILSNERNEVEKWF